MSGSQVGQTSTAMETTMALLVEGDRPLVRARFEYRTDEPFGVHMTLSLEDGSAVEWVIARELIIQGVHVPAGLADVQLYPISDAIVIELDSPDGGAVLLADPAAMYEFAVEIQQLVPLGSEDQFFCLDDALAEIFQVELPRSSQS